MSMPTVKTAAITGVLAAAMLVSGCAASGGEGGESTDAQEIIIGYLPAGYSAAIKLGDEQGIFEEHGLKLVYGKPASSGAAQITQLLSGQLDVAIGAPTGVISAVSNGVPVKIVSGVDRDFDEDGQNFNGTFVAPDSGITSFKDLAGKTVGMNSLQGNWEMGLKEAIAADGGDPSQVEVTQIPFAEGSDALAQGRVDAVSVVQPFAAGLLSNGYINLGNTQAIATGESDTGNALTYMSQAFIDSEPDVVETWVAALDEASIYANEHPDEVRAVIVQETGAPAELIDAAPVPVFGVDVREATLARWADLLAEYGIIKSAPEMSQVIWDGAPRA